MRREIIAEAIAEIEYWRSHAAYDAQRLDCLLTGEREAERAAIVAWLTEQGSREAWHCATEIEAGEHLAE